MILGTGWGATSVLKTIDASKYDVTVVSPRNYFLMTALLPGVTVGTVEGRSIVENVRRLLPGDGRFYEATAVDVDPVAKTVTCVDRSPLTVDFPNEPFLVPYDRLVVSVGAPFNTFRVPGVDKHAIKVKEVEDALAVRSRLMDMLETASLPGVDDETRRRVCSVVVVGGGPYGVNIAAEISDFLRQDAPRLYPDLRGVPSVTILSSQDHILSVYDERISRFAEDNSRGTRFACSRVGTCEGVPHGTVRRGTSDGRACRVPFGVCVWATGLGVNPLVRAADAVGTQKIAIDIGGFVSAGDGRRGVYAVGDCADVKEASCRARTPPARYSRERTSIATDPWTRKNSGVTGTSPGDAPARRFVFGAEGVHRARVDARRRDAQKTTRGGVPRGDGMGHRIDADLDVAEATGSSPDANEARLTYEEFRDALAGVDAKARGHPRRRRWRRNRVPTWRARSIRTGHPRGGRGRDRVQRRRAHPRRVEVPPHGSVRAARGRARGSGYRGTSCGRG